MEIKSFSSNKEKEENVVEIDSNPHSSCFPIIYSDIEIQKQERRKVVTINKMDELIHSPHGLAFIMEKFSIFNKEENSRYNDLYIKT
jgi:hypothetical protein